MTPAPILLDDVREPARLALEIGALKLVRVEAPGPLLDAAYRLLTRVFPPEVVDSKETYIDLLSPDGLLLDGFRVICLAAFFDLDGEQVLVGFVSSNLMWIDRSKGLLQLAIGNIATSEALRRTGFRGVGTALLNSAIDYAKKKAIPQNGTLAYSVAEAEEKSLGFWKKRGFLYPQGIKYWQPPLEFDENGERIHDEVNETFLVCPLDDQDRRLLGVQTLRAMILAIYRNWCIETNRAQLSVAALEKTKRYVMNHVFPLVDATIPRDGFVRLETSPG